MKYLKIFVIALNLFCFTAQYGITVFRSDHGPKISRLTGELNALKEQNSDLLGQINTQNSLSVIESRASELHLTRLSSVTLPPVTVAQR